MSANKDLKRCRRCKQLKPRHLYFFNSTIERRICQECLIDTITNGQICKACDKQKPITDFRQSAQYAWHHTCKSCTYLRDADSVRQKPERKAYYVLQEKKSFASKRNLKFDLDLDWYMTKLNNGYCEVTGIRFYLHNEPGNIGHPHQPAIDRIIPGGDYTKANCRLVCRIFNIARGNYPDEVFLDMCRRVVQNGLIAP